MKFRCASTITFVLSQLLANTVAVPEATGSIEPLQNQPLESVELEFGRQYSRAELDNLLQQSSGNDQFTNLSIGKVDATQTEKSDLEAGTVEVGSELAQQSVYLHKQVLLGYFGSCAMDKNVANSFVMDVSYNGQHVIYSPKLKTIDKFGYIGVGGGRGKPITSTADFQKDTCRFLNSGHMCAYRFFGTAGTTVTVFGKNRGVAVQALQSKAGFATENCVVAQGPAQECPRVDPNAPHCTFRESISRPYPEV